MKKDDDGIMLVLGLIGLGIVGVLSYLVVSEDGKIERRINKKGRKLSKTEGDDNIISLLDPVDKILYEVAREILKKNDPSIYRAEVFLSTFIRVAITRVFEDEEALRRLPSNVEQLERLLKRFGLHKSYHVMLSRNDSIRIKKRSEKFKKLSNGLGRAADGTKIRLRLVLPTEEVNK